MDSDIFVLAIVLNMAAAGCFLVGVVISLQQSRQPGWDSRTAPTARFRQWMGAGSLLCLVGAALMFSTFL
ncbi:hypothetical protein [Kocuria rosea]|uniref:hypothetical protein n=1 Tax=Kocuria rosea TaxID=1275 RepID=UPI00232E8565|nr:hypothetical protein [Kocuria rosea]